MRENYTDIDLPILFQAIEIVDEVHIRYTQNNIYEVHGWGQVHRFTIKGNLLLSKVESARFTDIYSLLKAIYSACNMTISTPTGQRIWGKYKWLYKQSL